MQRMNMKQILLSIILHGYRIHVFWAYNLIYNGLFAIISER
jgi:hypothetical protein